MSFIILTAKYTNYYSCLAATLGFPLNKCLRKYGLTLLIDDTSVCSCALGLLGHEIIIKKIN